MPHQPKHIRPMLDFADPLLVCFDPDLKRPPSNYTGRNSMMLRRAKAPW